jgi:hypothetical protein
VNLTPFLYCVSAVGEWAASIASLANAIQITVLNAVYQYVAIWLTELENPRSVVTSPMSWTLRRASLG